MSKSRLKVSLFDGLSWTVANSEGLSALSYYTECFAANLSDLSHSAHCKGLYNLFVLHDYKAPASNSIECLYTSTIH